MPSIFEKYHLKQVINTSGRMTALGVSTPRPEVVEAAMAGMNQYFEMKDLVNKTGEYIAKLLDVEGATVVSCASAAITPRTAAILYIKSHHCVQKSMLNVAQAAEVARQHNVPLIVDAAAEEDLQCYYRMGADLVIYSGAKAIEGPTSGLVIGKTQYVEWVKRQSMGIGRAMKVGKEGILGLTCAIEHYLTASKESGEQMVAKMTPFIEQLNALNGVTARVVWDSAGRDIARAEIKFDEVTTGVKTGDLVNALKQGEYAIYFRGYKANEGIIEADVRSVNAQQLEVVARRIAEVLNKEKQA
ncbi:PLP-dependent aminotransferase family protein [Klebsiella pneumoniae]